MVSPIEIIVNIVQVTCVIIVAAQLVVSVRILRAPLEEKGTLNNTLLLIIGFGLLAIYSSYSGFRILGAIINVRDLGPMIAGLMGGPVAGIGAGLIGGIHRFSMGGPTAIPCSVATVLAGLIAGYVFIRYNSHFCGVKTAGIVAALMECLHMGLILLLVRPFSAAWDIVSSIAIPMIVGNFMGMVVFSFIITDFIKRSRNEQSIGIISEEKK